MTRFCTVLVGLLAICGCGQKQIRILAELPDPIVDIRRRPKPKPAPAVKLPTLQHSPAQSTIHAEPGWTPAAGISPRWECVVLHHSANEGSSPSAMDRYHRQHNGWDELGYHFVIGNGVAYPDGQVYVGPRWRKQKHGAHCKTPDNYYNDHGIGICLIGNFDQSYPTAAQMAALSRLCRFLTGKCGFSSDKIYTHGGVTGRTRCPGRHFNLARLKNDLAR